MKTSWRHICKMSWKCLEGVLRKTFSQDVLKTPWGRLEDVFFKTFSNIYVLKASWRRLGKASWRRLEDVFKTYDQDEYIGLGQNVLKTSCEGAWARRIYSSWSRLLLMTRTKDIFKTSSRSLYQDECLLDRESERHTFTKRRS